MPIVSIRVSAAYRSVVEEDLLATSKACCRRVSRAGGANHLAWYRIVVDASCSTTASEGLVDDDPGDCKAILPAALQSIILRVSRSQIDAS